MADQPIPIKRYPNRRFYDKNASKYVSLKDIEDLVSQGNTVEIRDSQSGDDMTRAVLTQIILDRQPEKISLFPVDMLHGIVRSNDLVAGFLRDYFQHSLTYLDYLQKHGAAAATGDLANPMHWVKAWLDGVRPSGEGPKEAPKPEGSLEEKIRRLEERIRQLESKEP